MRTARIGWFWQRARMRAGRALTTMRRHPRAALLGGVVALAVLLSLFAFFTPDASPPPNVVIVPSSGTCRGAAGAPNSIVAENTCPGTDSWRDTLSTGASNAINAFPVPASVNRGQSIRLYISTTASTYTFRVYRMGWYQGHGARLMYASGRLRGFLQPPPTFDPVTLAASCANWHLSVTLRIPSSWVSGVYIVKLISSRGNMRYTLFVVRDDASHAPMLFQLALNTYQAYNNYGGRSFYGGEGGQSYASVVRSFAVSYDRPYDSYDGLSLFPRYEYDLIRFLERNGYDLSYAADVDLVLHPAALGQHKLVHRRRPRRILVHTNAPSRHLRARPWRLAGLLLRQ